MDITVTVDRRSRSDAFLAALDVLVPMVVKKTGYDLQALMVKEIQNGAKSGIPYKRKGGRVHIASAPGEAPATDTGNLAGSIGPFTEVSAFVGTVPIHAAYAHELEYGGARVAARPFVRPAVAAIGPIFARAIAAAVAKAAAA